MPLDQLALLPPAPAMPTNADKRRSVELALAEWPKLSDVELSRICAVGKTMVGEVRRDIQPVEKTGSETRIGADGKERKMPAHQCGGLATSFDCWLELRFNTPEQIREALRLIADHVEALLATATTTRDGRI